MKVKFFEGATLRELQGDVNGYLAGKDIAGIQLLHSDKFYCATIVPDEQQAAGPGEVKEAKPVVAAKAAAPKKAAAAKKAAVKKSVDTDKK